MCFRYSGIVRPFNYGLVLSKIFGKTDARVSRSFGACGEFPAIAVFPRRACGRQVRRFEIGVVDVLGGGQLIVRAGAGDDQLRDGDLQCGRVAVLRVLDREDDEEGEIVVPVLMTNCQVSLQCIAKVKQRPAHGPHHDDTGRDDKCSRPAR